MKRGGEGPGPEGGRNRPSPAPIRMQGRAADTTPTDGRCSRMGGRKRAGDQRWPGMGGWAGSADRWGGSLWGLAGWAPPGPKQQFSPGQPTERAKPGLRGRQVRCQGGGETQEEEQPETLEPRDSGSGTASRRLRLVLR